MKRIILGLFALALLAAPAVQAQQYQGQPANGETHFRPNGTSQSVAYSGTAGTISNPTSAGVMVLRVMATTDAFITVGASPTATTAGVFLPAGVPEYFTIHSGEKVSAIQASAAGTLYVSEMAQ